MQHSKDIIFPEYFLNKIELFVWSHDYITVGWIQEWFSSLSPERHWIRKKLKLFRVGVGENGMRYFLSKGSNPTQEGGKSIETEKEKEWQNLRPLELSCPLRGNDCNMTTQWKDKQQHELRSKEEFSRYNLLYIGMKSACT